jgi:hypothetical protein
MITISSGVTDALSSKLMAKIVLLRSLILYGKSMVFSLNTESWAREKESRQSQAKARQARKRTRA